MTRLLARDVEADDPALAVRDRELRHLERIGAVAHRADDLAERDAVFALGALEPLPHGLNDLLEVEAARRVEHRRVADLRVHDPVAREIIAALVRDALERFLSLHDRDRVVEATQIERERPGRSARMEPTTELVRVRGRKARVADIPGELDDRRGTQAAIEMVVQQDLRRGSQRFERDHALTRLCHAEAPVADTGSRRSRTMKMSARLTQRRGTAEVGV